QRMCGRQIKDLNPVLGNDRIINDNERFSPTASCSLESPKEVGWTMHWEKQELKAKLSARSFYCAHCNICAGVRFVPGAGHFKNAGKSPLEQREPLST